MWTCAIFVKSWMLVRSSSWFFRSIPFGIQNSGQLDGIICRSTSHSAQMSGMDLDFAWPASCSITTLFRFARTAREKRVPSMAIRTSVSSPCFWFSRGSHFLCGSVPGIVEVVSCWIIGAGCHLVSGHPWEYQLEYLSNCRRNDPVVNAASNCCVKLLKIRTPRHKAVNDQPDDHWSCWKWLTLVVWLFIHEWLFN